MIEYYPEVLSKGDPPEPNFLGRPPVDGWTRAEGARPGLLENHGTAYLAWVTKPQTQLDQTLANAMRKMGAYTWGRPGRASSRNTVLPASGDRIVLRKTPCYTATSRRPAPSSEKRGMAMNPEMRITILRCLKAAAPTGKAVMRSPQGRRTRNEY